MLSTSLDVRVQPPLCPCLIKKHCASRTCPPSSVPRRHNEQPRTLVVRVSSTSSKFEFPYVHTRLSRRDLAFAGLLAVLQAVPRAPAFADDDAPRQTLSTQRGVKYQIVREGTGDVAKAGDYVTFDYVLRRSNGYFVYSTTGSGSGQQEPFAFAQNFQEEPVTFQLGGGQLISGLEEVLEGGQVGERIRALIPPEAGYLPGAALQPVPPAFGPRRELASHANQPLFFELEVRKITSPR